MPDTPRRRGRPRLAPEGSAAVTLALPVKEFDRYCALARVERMTLSELLRRELRRGRTRSGDPPTS